MPTADTALSCAGVDYSYGPVQVLFDVQLRVAPGEMVAICGPNGVGKSTLVGVLAGLRRPSRGSVRLFDRDITAVPAAARVGLGLSTVVGQAAFGSLTVLENLRVQAYAQRRSRAELQRAIHGAFEVFPRLGQRRDQAASTLSGGERQMLVLAKALIQRPRLLLVDEFSLGLAPVVVGGLLEMMRRLNALGTTMLVVEQSVNVALALVHRAYFLEKGSVIAEHSAGELAAHPELAHGLMLGGHA